MGKWAFVVGEQRKPCFQLFPNGVRPLRGPFPSLLHGHDERLVVHLPFACPALPGVACARTVQVLREDHAAARIATSALLLALRELVHVIAQYLVGDDGLSGRPTFAKDFVESYVLIGPRDRTGRSR